MKIIHTADWHIGQTFYNYERDEEHEYFFAQLANILRERRPDALVVCGDIFHNSTPSITAKRLMVRGVLKLREASEDTAIILTAGNHDSGARLEADKELWDIAGVHVIGTNLRNEDGCVDLSHFVVEIPGKGFVLAVPYFHPSNFPLVGGESDEERRSSFFNALLDYAAERNIKNLPIIMTAHLALTGCDTTGHDVDRAIGGMFTEDPKRLGVGYDYLALGHIHKAQNIGERIRYSGSAIPVSFSEKFAHTVSFVEIDSHGAIPSIEEIEIESLNTLKSIPEEGATFEEAMSALSSLADSDNCYVRAMIKQAEPLPADADDIARKVLEGKQCRFCGCVREVPKNHHNHTDESNAILEIADLENLKAINIALEAYRRFNDGAELPEKLRNILEDVIKSVDEGIIPSDK